MKASFINREKKKQNKIQEISLNKNVNERNDKNKKHMINNTHTISKNKNFKQKIMEINKKDINININKTCSSTHKTEGANNKKENFLVNKDIKYKNIDKKKIIKHN